MPSIKKEYNQFLNTANGAKSYNDFKNILYSTSDSLIKTFKYKVLPILLAEIKISDTMRICDIGGGDGKRIIDIITFLRNTLSIPHFQLDFIEQSIPFSKSFHEKSKKIEPFCNITAYNELFESVELNENVYDFVFLIHSIFAFENENSINKVLSLVNSNGKVVFFSNEDNSFLAILKRHLDGDYDDRRFEISDLKSILNKNNIQYTNYTFNTEFIINEQDVDLYSDKILYWLSLGKYNNFIHDKKNEIKSILISLGEKQADYYRFTEKEELIIIPPVKKTIVL